jgi:hypothetical protein
VKKVTRTINKNKNNEHRTTKNYDPSTSAVRIIKYKGRIWRRRGGHFEYNTVTVTPHIA